MENFKGKKKGSSIGGNKVIVAVGAVVMIVIMVFLGSFLRNTLDGYFQKKQQPTAPTSVQNTQKTEVTAYIVQKDVKAGDDVQTNVVPVKKDLSTLPKGALVNTTKLSGVFTEDLMANDVVLERHIMDNSLAYSDNDRLTEHTFEAAAIPVEVTVGRYVDVCFYAQGKQDSVVLSKKPVVRRNGNLLAFYLEPGERELLKEAAMDSEGTLVLVVYLSEDQPASPITYVPRYIKGGASPTEDKSKKTFSEGFNQ